MLKFSSYKLLLFLLTGFAGFAQSTPPQPIGPLPSANQLRWQKMDYYAFIHFSINTYTDMAWGLGNEDPKLLNPTKLDCRQWARICKEAGMKGIIFTAKHHSGFCLWPSKYMEYSVKNVPWRNGKADILRFPTVEATKVRLTILDAKGCPLISNLEVYKAPLILTPPTVARDQSGEIRIKPGDTESELYNTLDGSTPTVTANRYTTPVKAGMGKVELKAIAYNPFTKQSSIVSEEKFDVDRAAWKILSTDAKSAYQVLDGNANTSWHQEKSQAIHMDLVIDLGKEENLAGFRYLPAQNWWEEASIITHYQVEASADNVSWKRVSEGDFQILRTVQSGKLNRSSPPKPGTSSYVS